MTYPLIILDPGHGGRDRANRGPTGYVEADGVLDIGLKLRNLLIAEGYSVKMTREVDETVDLHRRCEMANQWQGDLFISLHTNAGPSTANGIEIFHTLINEWRNQEHCHQAKKVAQVLQHHLIQSTGLRDRGVKTRLIENSQSTIYKKDYYAVIRRSNMPALIIEMGFHSNPQEEALLKTDSFREKLAKAILNGIKEVYPLEGESTSIPDDTKHAKKIKLRLHGHPLSIDGLFIEDTNYIPIRFLRELGYDVIWNGAEDTVEINYRK